jgi:molybdopterin molybdotransferase
LLSTGDEIRDPGEPLPPGSIYDANRFMLGALLAEVGCAVTDFGIRPDREAALVDALADASTGHDLIVTSGGVSTGEEDHVKSAVERLGTLHFWRLAIKPGRPVALGQVRGVPFVGLPGNPVAVIVTFIVLTRPLIAKLAGSTPPPPRLFPVRTGFSYRKKPGRREYLRASLDRDGDAVVAIKYPRDGAGILSSIVRSDGLVIFDEAASSLAIGTMVDFLPFSEVIG